MPKTMKEKMMSPKQMEKMSKGKSRDMMGQKMPHTDMMTSKPMGDMKKMMSKSMKMSYK